MARMLGNGGAYHVGSGQMPSLTNPNNLSIVSGVPPSGHGVPGNHYLDPVTQEEVQLTDPSFLRAGSMHAAMRAAGVAVLCVTAKDKLRRLLADGDVPAISAERADSLELPAFGISDLTGLVGVAKPGIYDWDLSVYAMRLGLAVHRRVPIGLLYVSLTDFVQHKAAPGSELADTFIGAFDSVLGDYLAEGFRVGITADHGMNAKPVVHFLEDVLEAAGVKNFRVVLPITDPYVVHHGALGSFAWVHVPQAELDRAREALVALDGIEEVFDREQAAEQYDHPIDRIGDLSVASDARTALGKSRQKHDLSHVEGGLRSHGGRHEQLVPIIVSEPLKDDYAAWHAAGVRNSDLHDLLLNGVREHAADNRP
jgi:phosphonoacetate hydrolase